MRIAILLVGMIELVVRFAVFLVGCVMILPIVFWVLENEVIDVLTPSLWEKL